jgi:hypothetical protein
VFTVEERDRGRDHVLAMAAALPRVPTARLEPGYGRCFDGLPAEVLGAGDAARIEARLRELG